MSLNQILADIRREERLYIALPVKVFLDSSASTPQWSCTHEISRRGVRLQGVRGVLSVGQEIWVQRQSRRAKYRIAFIGEAGTAHAGQFGAECLDQEKCIWEDELQAKLKP